MMQKNEIVKVKIEDIGVGGEGIGKVDGYTLFIKDAIIGDVVSESNESKEELRLCPPDECSDSIKRPCEEPVCPMARKCGGCQIQEMNIRHSLNLKKQRYAAIWSVSEEELAGSDHASGCRHGRRRNAAVPLPE